MTCAGFKNLTLDDASCFDWSCPNCALSKLKSEDFQPTLRSDLPNTIANAVVNEMSHQIQEIINEAVSNCNPRTYAQVVKNQQNKKDHIEMELIKKVAIDKHVPELLNDKKLKDERTCIVRQPQSSILSNSKIISGELNKLFPETLIRNCRTTAGGSILIEFDNEKMVLFEQIPTVLME